MPRVSTGQTIYTSTPFRCFICCDAVSPACGPCPASTGGGNEPGLMVGSAYSALIVYPRENACAFLRILTILGGRPNSGGSSKCRNEMSAAESSGWSFLGASALIVDGLEVNAGR